MICAIGVDAVRHIRRRREFLVLAWIPLLLGAHQFIEALVWFWLQGHVPGWIGHAALWAYLLIAFVLLPVFIPAAVIALEPTRWRKLMMAPFASIGAVIAILLLAAMIRGPVGVKLAPPCGAGGQPSPAPPWRYTAASLSLLRSMGETELTG